MGVVFSNSTQMLEQIYVMGFIYCPLIKSFRQWNDLLLNMQGSYQVMGQKETVL